MVQQIKERLENKMILVDVYVPAIDEYCDFILDENAKVKQIIGEISEMVSKKMKNQISDKTDQFMLCSMEQQEILPKEKTLMRCKIKDGSTLLLV